MAVIGVQDTGEDMKQHILQLGRKMNSPEYSAFAICN
jgi:hypothetical protein